MSHRKLKEPYLQLPMSYLGERLRENGKHVENLRYDDKNN